MRTLTVLAVAGILIPSLLTIFQKRSNLSQLDVTINALAKFVKLSIVIGFGFGALALVSSASYYISPIVGLAQNPDTIEISIWALQYYAIIGIVLPILGILIGSFLSKRQEAN
ncbi:hypothetical protein KMW28_00735 [Flammeovirga yaeyamensis]|uniref:MotA/TolQ/ExbB proton channel domain-containing protein n=1 Tax=Flammeovirga yaeyamensis TaxID=367791 RepID=A0AAX1N3K7_9BACT|nr:MULTISPECIES: hypothetical protein [Flammeovirga]ANQ50435.2 hypothetical protein MY04_3067 [Flammeovirga sp. MY04]MBB3699607.1 cytochrome c biogenesis protein CcdA [Flammeovirga yaeyamensis]NMF36820.1 hypothetical protein [Flammeovirga yaeyamensis]QWG02140.1 hypothetical protein KMW28_00735 [Flammeovirga yaeyamensis]